MANVQYGSAGVTAREIDLSGPVTVQPSGVPAGVIGTAKKGPAFVPVTVGIIDDFYSKFGQTDGKKFGPLAVNEWLKNASSVTYMRTLGVGTGGRRELDGNLAGRVPSAGFVVGENQPDPTNEGALSSNPYANTNGVPGRTYFLGCLMSSSLGSTFLSDPGIQPAGSNVSVPILRAVVLAASGVILRLSSSAEGSNDAPASSLIAADATAKGQLIGSVVLQDVNVVKEDFVMLLNGHKGTDTNYPNTITASFDRTASNYFVNKFNSDPYLYQKAGHLLYSVWDIPSALAVVTGSGIVTAASGAFGGATAHTGVESSAFLTTGSLARNVGSSVVPNYENFEDRFGHGVSPWIISQRFGGYPVNLFRLHMIDDGVNTSNLYKVSIENVASSPNSSYMFGTFDVVVRAWNDKDDNQIVVESFRGLSLDPSNDRYISKVIGDQHSYFEFDRATSAQKIVVDGNYVNQSNIIRVEISSDVENAIVDQTSLPFGFRGPRHLVTSGSAPMISPVSTQHSVSTILKSVVEPPLPLRQNITIGSGNKKSVNPLLYWGVQFENVTDVSAPNAGYEKNSSVLSMAKYFPDFSTANVNFVVGENEGTPDSAELGIIDSDRFCKNLFSLENVQVVTGSDTKADPQQWQYASYIRAGGISSDDSAKTRGLLPIDLTTANRKFVKFSFFMQGGFDGTNIFDRDENELTNLAVDNDFNSATTRGGVVGPNVSTWRKTIDVMKSTTNVDIKLLAIPGLRHPIVTDYAIQAVQDRFDAMYIMDIEDLDDTGELTDKSGNLSNVNQTSSGFRDRALDSSFAAAYYPDVAVKDPNTNSNVFVPASVVVLGAMALNDSIGHPWFAPAGFTRGVLDSVLETKVKLNKTGRDTLYDASINPLTSFSQLSGNQGSSQFVVWGQKTLQAAATALDRVNVRRLLIDIRRDIRSIAQTFVFEPNRAATLAKFSAAVTPRLQKVQSQSGLESFKVAIDASTTTQADVEANTLRGKIWIVPTRTTEFVSLDFVVSNTI